jgi:hypothetical protein
MGTLRNPRVGCTDRVKEPGAETGVLCLVPSMSHRKVVAYRWAEGQHGSHFGFDRPANFDPGQIVRATHGVLGQPRIDDRVVPIGHGLAIGFGGQRVPQCLMSACHSEAGSARSD